MKKIKKISQVLLFLAMILPMLASPQDTSGSDYGSEESTERRFWGWQKDGDGSGISYCGGSCAAIVYTETYYVFWIPVSQRTRTTTVTINYPCGDYEL